MAKKQLKIADPEMASLDREEEERQFWNANFIASENYVSPAVREAMSSVLTNKYSEGYSGARYYGGNEIVDKIETLTEKRALDLFGLTTDKWDVNVQPYSGSPANLAVYLGLLNPQKDTALGMSLDAGGHLTHGAPPSASGRLFNFVQYGLDANGYLDYRQVDKLARQHKPKLIVAGISAYSRTVDFERLGKIARKHNALLMADIAHIAGLVAAGVHPSPFPHCDIVTTTTHKTLRGPRGAMVFARVDKEIERWNAPGKKPWPLHRIIRSAVFPGVQGGPHNHQTMAIGVALKEARSAAFRRYANKIVKNAYAMAEEFKKLGFAIISGGTDNHLMLVDLRPFEVTGTKAEQWLEQASIVVNKNAIPNDPLPPMQASGIRVGTPAMTTRGMKTQEMRKFARFIKEVISDPSKETITKIRQEVRKLCAQFPPP